MVVLFQNFMLGHIHLVAPRRFIFAPGFVLPVLDGKGCPSLEHPIPAILTPAIGIARPDI